MPRLTVLLLTLETSFLDFEHEVDLVNDWLGVVELVDHVLGLLALGFVFILALLQDPHIQVEQAVESLGNLFHKLVQNEVQKLLRSQSLVTKELVDFHNVLDIDVGLFLLKSF